MEKKTNRLYFIDAMRAWAILMMLQGHFIDGLLDFEYRDKTILPYAIWSYFRGMTAPVFFTVSGFIFTYLLVKGDKIGLKNPRVKKGIKRGLQLILIGYLLRMNLFSVLFAELYDSFYYVDVLHCIGFSILGIIALYLLTSKTKPIVFATILLSITLLLFLYEPSYDKLPHTYLPKAIANYITKLYGSVFTIIPWFGYATFGAFMAMLFTKFKNHKHLYLYAILICTTLGLFLIFGSSPLFAFICDVTGNNFLYAVYTNNYLFIRLGDVLIIFSLFMMLRSFLTNKVVLRIGQNTLAIYVIHFIILYGSFTGLGIYHYLKYSLHPATAIIGAILFMISCTYLALLYDTYEDKIKATLQKIKFGALKLFRLAKN
ncbi:membrane protein [Cellulophaga lytica]|uniref:heparan-alpha-glucosaminide N-acetyltransferase domain-containing protein n=1 Tax=Cellulophaga lytica TaxID=979 RepID=UPI0004F885A2|nr:heparan-alpha-glucosaminide N-acetyltransferase domain-containing protein [Cellulophaga lytica]AIM61815.1 membrane protein [Cellulophaga lytica]